MNTRRLMCLLVALPLLGPALASAVQASSAAPTGPAWVIVNGAAGEEAYGDVLARQAAAWEKAATTAGVRPILIGRESPEATADRTRLEQTLAAEPKAGTDPLWIVLIGHGTFDKKVARFNLRGDDVTAADLAAWLQPFQRPLAVINTASASAPFLNALSAPGRVVVTATRSGNEQNYARFGASLAAVLGDPAADLDQDGQVSLLEAFLAASAKVNEFYQTEGRLATEHALIDDNGDGLGTPAAWFRGLRATKKPKDAAALDGPRAHQWFLTRDAATSTQSPEWRARRDALESSLATLRDQKDSLPPESYYRQLETLLLDLARHYQSGPGLQDDAAPPSDHESR
jgi:hypothetical protein